MESRLAQEVCSILKRELKKEGVSYRELASHLSISEVSIKRLLNNYQSLSMQRLIAISAFLKLTLSKLLEEAERNINTVPLFTKEQDQAFFDCPALHTFWIELTEHRTAKEIADRHQLDKASTYLYLRKLEKVGLIRLGLDNQCRLCVPTHTSFEKGSKYPIYFTSQVLTRLQQRVIDLPVEDDQAFLITLKAELTHEEFLDITHKLDDWMFNLLGHSQDRKAREGLVVSPYTFGFMAAKGAFHDKFPEIHALDEEL